MRAADGLLLRLVGLALAVGVSACMGILGANSPPEPEPEGCAPGVERRSRTVGDGDYTTSDGGSCATAAAVDADADAAVDAETGGDSGAPLLAGGEVRVTVDRAKNRVVVWRERDGRTIEQVWSIVSTRTNTTR